MSVIGTIQIGFSTGVGKLRQDMGTAGSIIASAGSSWANLGGAVTAVQGAFALVGGAARTATGLITSTVGAASDLAEATDLVRVQFGPAADTVIGKADELANKFGVVKTEFLSGTGTLAGLLDQMGKGSEVSAAFANDLGKLALDMSSAFNTRFPDELDRIRAGLSGESEPLRRYGVDLSAAAVEQEALRSGLAKTAKELTNADKVTARAAIIFRDLAKISGNVEQTFGGVANQARSVAGRLENLKADVGGAFTSISQAMLASVGDTLVELVNGFGDVRQSVKDWADESIQYGGVVNEAVGFLGEGIARLSDSWDFVRVAFLKTQSFIGTGIAEILGWYSGLFGAIDRGLEAIGATSTGVGETLANMAAAVRETAGRQMGEADALAATESRADAIRGVFGGIQEKLNRIGVDAQKATEPLATNTQRASENVAEMQKQLQFAGAMEFGSAEAMKTIITARAGGDGAQQQAAKAAQDNVVATRQVRDELRLIGKAFTFQTVDI